MYFPIMQARDSLPACDTSQWQRLSIRQLATAGGPLLYNDREFERKYFRFGVIAAHSTCMGYNVLK